MSATRITIEHVNVTIDQPFENVVAAIERQLGRFDPAAYEPLNNGGDPETARANVAALAGSSGLMLFSRHDHGRLLRMAGQQRKAMQYILGNPLFAVRMTAHDLRASLYAPLRLLVYENESQQTCVEYDKPSTVFGQFGNPEIAVVAAELDAKLERLVSQAV